jgi:sugar phosphate permease
MEAKRKIFWGWYVVTGAFIIFGINYGARYCFGVFLKPMCEDLGWSRSVVSVAASLAVLFYGIGGIFAGRLLDRLAPHWIITVGAVSAALGFILTRFVSTPLQFYLAYGVLFGLAPPASGSSSATPPSGNGSSGSAESPLRSAPTGRASAS